MLDLVHQVRVQGGQLGRLDRGLVRGLEGVSAVQHCGEIGECGHVGDWHENGRLVARRGWLLATRGRLLIAAWLHRRQSRSQLLLAVCLISGRRGT